ncbi:MAG TPA: S1 family peptidase [Kofleriaceae bacterium]
MRIGLAALLLASCADSGPTDDSDDPEDTAAPNSDSDEIGAETFAAETGISLVEAQQRLGWQTSSDALDAELAPRETYGGIWIDPGHGDRVQVGMVGTADDADVMAAATRLAMADGTDVVHVTHSFAELQQIFDEIDAKLDGTTLGVSLDVEHNRVTIDIPATPLAPAESELVANFTARYGDAIASVPSQIGDASLASLSNVYSPPARGGTLIQSINNARTERGTCTSGFFVHGKSSGLPYLLTAGHCFAGGFDDWFTFFTPNGAAHAIGAKGVGAFTSTEDAGLIHIANAKGWKPAPWIVVHTGKSTAFNSHYVIRSNGTSSMNRFVCHNGVTSGTSCGRVVNPNTTVPYEDEQHHVHQQHNQTLTTMCGAKGDSGGPVFVSHQALGTFSLAGHFTNGTCAGSYQRISLTEKQLGISVAHCGGKGASVETRYDCCSLEADHSRSNTFLTCE